MAQRSNKFSDLAVENAIQDLKKIQLKRFDNESLTKLQSPIDLKNNNFFEEDDNNNLDNNDNFGNLADGSKVRKINFQTNERLRWKRVSFHSIFALDY